MLPFHQLDRPLNFDASLQALQLRPACMLSISAGIAGSWLVHSVIVACSSAEVPLPSSIGIPPWQASWCLLQAWEGEGVVAAFRKVVGATNPLQAEPGTIRGDLARVIGRNIVHASDSPAAGSKESGAFLVELRSAARLRAHGLSWAGLLGVPGDSNMLA